MDGANHEGLATLLRTNGDPVGDGTAEDLGQGPPVFMGMASVSSAVDGARRQFRQGHVHEPGQALPALCQHGGSALETGKTEQTSLYRIGCQLVSGSVHRFRHFL